MERLLGFVSFRLSKESSLILLTLEEPESEKLSLIDRGAIGIDEQLIAVRGQGNEHFE
jgi:hypothetical protein